MTKTIAALAFSILLAIPASRAGEPEKAPEAKAVEAGGDQEKKLAELQEELKRQAAEVERLKKQLKDEGLAGLAEKRFKKGRVQVVERSWPKALLENIVVVHDKDGLDIAQTLLAGVTARALDGKNAPETAVPTRVLTVKDYLEAVEKGAKWAPPMRRGGSYKKDLKDDLGEGRCR